MLKKKSIVLSDISNNSSKKAVLSLEEDGVGVKGTLRLYNFPFELSGISSLGFYVDKKVYKAGLTYKSHMLYDFFLSISELPNEFSCAVVNFQNAVATPILYGSSEGNNENIYGSIISEIAKDNSLKNTKQTLDNFGVDFDEEEKKQIEKEIDSAICGDNCGNCSDCVYKKYFYENQSKETEPILASSLQKEENSSLIDKDNEKSSMENEKKDEEESEIIFIDKLKPQIDKLFETNPMEDNLQKLIPYSKWVKVEYEDDGDFYVFGLLYDENDNVKYVCYGVPAVFEEEPPKELSGYPIWLPLDKDNKRGFGYWLTYQDATTGEPVKAIID